LLWLLGLACVQAVLLASLSPVEVPVWPPLGARLGIAAVLQLQNAMAKVAALNHCALLKLLTSVFHSFADPIQLRFAQGGDSFDDLIGIQEIPSILMCIHTNIIALYLRLRNLII
jgi:hypothetical protein